MTHLSLKRLLGFSLLAAGLVFGSVLPGYAAKCPPEHKKADVRPPPSNKIWDGAQLATEGITDATIATVEIAKEPFNIKGRVLRTRTLMIEPGTVVPWHSHDDRPAIMYVVKGELTEYASNCAVPVTYKAGDHVAEGPGLSHWWQNHGNETHDARLDRPSEDGKKRLRLWRMTDLWVFGYGSLMWRPGFEFEEQAPAALIGAHRSLCIYSFHHRGSTEAPGLVLGLDEGGACRGIAFRVPRDKHDLTIAYLREREQVTDVYVEVFKPITLLDGSNRELEALCYVADRSHPQYAGRLSIDAQARLVRSAVGRSGSNIEYVLNTVSHLDEAGIHDVELMALAAHLGRK